MIILALRLPLLAIPLERDEGEYAYIAWRMNFKEMPYREWVDQKPPGIFWVYRLAFSFPMEPVRAIHLAGALFGAASAAALFLLARRFTGDFWATTAAALFGVLCADPNVDGTATNTELLMLLPLILSLLAFVASLANGRSKFLLMVLSGVLTGLAAVFKQVAAVNWVFLIIAYPLLVGPREKLRRTVLFAAGSTAGMAAVWVLVGLYFFSKGCLSDFIFNVFTQNLDYIGALTWADRFNRLKFTLATLVFSHGLIWFFAIIGLASLYCRRHLGCLVFLGGWAFTSIVAVSASGYFFPHYFQQLLPVLSVAAAIGGALLDDAPYLNRVPVLARRSVLVAGLTILPAIVLFPFLVIYSPEEAVRRIYPGNQFAKMPEIGKRIAEITQPSDRVFVFGAEPEVLFYARRASATRYIYLFPLFTQDPKARENQVAAALEVSNARPTVSLYLPNALFFMPGLEQYFASWSVEYLRENFIPDRWLTVDKSGATHVTAGPGASGDTFVKPPNCIGAVLVRRSPRQTDQQRAPP